MDIALPLELPEVTLCAIDCVNPELALRAIEICMAQCRFRDVLFLCDTAEEYHLDGCRMVTIPPITSRADYSRFVVKELGSVFESGHLLLIQWDGYVVNPGAWRAEFLDYDYIGAPWGFEVGDFRIGNGGFSLRSKRLFDALHDPEIVDLDPEDAAIGRRYRGLLEERYGVRFPDEALAGRFSFETTYFQDLPFGFHGLFNLWMFLPKQQLTDFVATLAPASVAGPQFLRLAGNYLDLGRREEAEIVLNRRLAVLADDAQARQLLLRVKPVSPPASRNADCPCGSGKRYKHCCGQVGTVAAPSRPDPDAMLRSAIECHRAGKLDDAQALYRRVVELSPGNSIAQHYLGVLAMQNGDPATGEAQIRAAIAQRSDIPDFHNNLGLCLRLQDRYPEAIAAYRQAVTLNPAYAPGYNNIGLDLQALGRVDEARRQFEQAIALQPDFAEAHWNLGLVLLLLGDFVNGWREYEWRLRCQPFVNDGLILKDVQPWCGEPLAGKTILVRREQGAGDTFQFLRFLPELAGRGASVLLDVSPDLARLAHSALPAAALVDRNAAQVNADYYVNLMSLGHWLGVREPDLATAGAYLSPRAEDVGDWQRRLEAFSGRRIGFVWAGNPKHANDRNRSCPLPVLRPEGSADETL